MSHDPYQEVTDRVIAALERGTVPWRKPWNVETGQPRNIEGRAYSGINSILLGMSGYGDPRWCTFNMAKRHGGKVRKGERGTFVVFFKRLMVKDKDTGEKRTIPLLKYFHVFNAVQIDGLDLEPLNTEPREVPVIDAAEAVWDEYPNRPGFGWGGKGAFYQPSTDRVQMPERERFVSPEAFYLTFWHELTHSTGHEKRLARADLKDISKFGDASYSREELCAEMGSAMIAARTGIVAPDIDQSAAYVASWLRALRNDKKMVVSAAARAQAATDWILGKQHEEEE